MPAGTAFGFASAMRFTAGPVRATRLVMAVLLSVGTTTTSALPNCVRRVALMIRSRWASAFIQLSFAEK